jgi:hypothetical protein
MIVRKYCERKRRRATNFAKEQNKKDLMDQFRTEMAEMDWYQCGTSRSKRPEAGTDLRYRYDGGYLGTGGFGRVHECGGGIAMIGGLCRLRFLSRNVHRGDTTTSGEEIPP